MNKFVELISKYLPPHISIPLGLHIVVVGGMLYITQQNLWAWIAEKLNVSTLVFTITTMAITLYLVLVASYVVLCFKIHKKLYPKFGVLWDKNKEPYCPIHEKPLSRHKTSIGGKTIVRLHCVKCKETLPLMADDTTTLTLEEVKKLL
jgi:hypothetical protein